MEASAKTAEGLRSRLFDALDGLIDGTVPVEKIESICYVSEQIIKTAKIELETMIEVSKIKNEEHARIGQATEMISSVLNDLDVLDVED